METMVKHNLCKILKKVQKFVSVSSLVRFSTLLEHSTLLYGLARHNVQLY